MTKSKEGSERADGCGDIHLQEGMGSGSLKRNRDPLSALLPVLALGVLVSLIAGGAAGWYWAKSRPAPQVPPLVLRGQVESERVPVRSPSRGTVQELNVDVDHRVEKGRVLAVIQDKDLDARIEGILAQARGLEEQLFEAERNLETSERNTAQKWGWTKEALDHAKERLDIEEKRLQRIAKGSDSNYVFYESNPSTVEESSSGMTALDLARRRVKEARAEVKFYQRSLDAEIGPEMGPSPQQKCKKVLDQILGGFQTIRQALVSVDRTFPVHSPVHGSVIRRMVQPGDKVQMDQVLLWVADHSTLWLHAEADLSLTAGAHVGRKVRAIPDAHPGVQIDGEVSRVELVGTREESGTGESPQSSRCRVVVTPVHSPIELVPGMPVTFYLEPAC
ncbi:MAG: efflux RND transporter periplasmic adaptor subunit [Syntrophobacteraceae bacterium]|nr:efflux RND transporter periplasmic adaptor subunit [Syntrophobacteraceae bacterium]